MTRGSSASELDEWRSTDWSEDVSGTVNRLNGDVEQANWQLYGGHTHHDVAAGSGRTITDVDTRSGEVVVALVDGDEATVKRCYRLKSRVKLQPANETMEPNHSWRPPPAASSG